MQPPLPSHHHRSPPTTIDLMKRIIKRHQEPATLQLLLWGILHHCPAGLDYATIETIATKKPSLIPPRTTIEESLSIIYMPPETMPARLSIYLLRLQEPSTTKNLVYIIDTATTQYQNASRNHRLTSYFMDTAATVSSGNRNHRLTMNIQSHRNQGYRNHRTRWILLIRRTTEVIRLSRLSIRRQQKPRIIDT